MVQSSNDRLERALNGWWVRAPGAGSQWAPAASAGWAGAAQVHS
jgi:hypothetical protein